MSFDLAFFLVLAAVLTGAIWLLDALLFKPRRMQAVVPGPDGAVAPREPVIVEYSRSFFPMIVLVLLVRSFLYEPFRIPSASMMPTLIEGDFILVNKYVYGLRLPVVNAKILALGEPARGDVVVFRKPGEPSVNFIKRVVGLPGDVIEYRNKRLTVNGQAVALELVGPYLGRGQPGSRLGREQLGQSDHEVLHITGRPSADGQWRVPEGHYFVMGDNRDNSHDSRFSDVSTIPEGNLVGRAVGIWLSLHDLSRIGDRII
jgi:signal peptidase I